MSPVETSKSLNVKRDQWKKAAMFTNERRFRRRAYVRALARFRKQREATKSERRR